jgi:outer membrane protein assembly factor BamB
MIMLQKKKKSIVAAVAVLLAAMTITSCTTNWPQFRGPEQNMVAKAGNLPSAWGEDTHIRWTVDMDGDSWTSPVVWGNQVFVSSAIPVKVSPEPERRDGDPPPEEEKSYLNDVYRWEVSCYDLANGELVWKQVAFEGSPRSKKNRATNYASETPVTDGKQLYVYFGMTGVYCYNLEGELQWEKDLGAYETMNEWGTGSSPVLYHDMLYVQVDNEEHSFIVALDAGSGEEIWKAERDEKTNYSTPFIWKNSVRTELVAGGKKARSYDPQTGEILWELEVAGRYSIPGPVADKDYLYLGNTAWRDIPGSMQCIRAGAEGDINPAEGETTSGGVVWSNLDAPTANPSPLLYGDLLYLVSGNGGEITCLDAATGEQVYREKIEKVAACWASPWAHEDKVYFIDEKGVTRVFKVGQEFELLHENALDDKFWASVAVTKDAYILKGVEKMYCIGN